MDAMKIQFRQSLEVLHADEDDASEIDTAEFQSEANFREKKLIEENFVCSFANVSTREPEGAMYRPTIVAD
ncbi:unnamed protein product [Strongylus vulgaris]|uniref:Uncharacterized protein n=1 Tax=Strongylus vulgaris TaxID=40348 RepID=A0A3P7LR33_STRVU|nr:unnamed protein product [Strongylus vulgaris]